MCMEEIIAKNLQKLSILQYYFQSGRQILFMATSLRHLRPPASGCVMVVQVGVIFNTSASVCVTVLQVEDIFEPSSSVCVAVLQVGDTTDTFDPSASVCVMVLQQVGDLFNPSASVCVTVLQLEE